MRKIFTIAAIRTLAVNDTTVLSLPSGMDMLQQTHNNVIRELEKQYTLGYEKILSQENSYFAHIQVSIDQEALRLHVRSAIEFLYRSWSYDRELCLKQVYCILDKESDKALTEYEITSDLTPETVKRMIEITGSNNAYRIALHIVYNTQKIDDIVSIETIIQRQCQALEALQERKYSYLSAEYNESVTKIQHAQQHSVIYIISKMYLSRTIASLSCLSAINENRSCRVQIKYTRYSAMSTESIIILYIDYIDDLPLTKMDAVSHNITAAIRTIITDLFDAHNQKRLSNSVYWELPASWDEVFKKVDQFLENNLTDPSTLKQLSLLLTNNAENS